MTTVDGSTVSGAEHPAGHAEHHALIVDADGACDFLAAHPGWCIFPGRMEWDNGRWLKLPARELPWSTSASDDPGVVRGLWKMYANPADGKAPIAVHVGKSNLVVLDTDKELEDPAWKDALDSTRTLVLSSCTRQMPHYIFLQPSGDDKVVIQDWPGGEVKTQNGYIFISDLPPKSGVLPLEIPPHILEMLRTREVGEDAGPTIRMSDRELEVWLSTTECRLPGSGEDEMIGELVNVLNHIAAEGHRRDAMRGACLTLAIEATAGLYGAQKAWDALEEAYIELRNDPVTNKGATGKAWSPKWWRDSRTLLAGAVEKVEAGRYDDAIAEKRERFGIWDEEEEARITAFFESLADEPDATSAETPPEPSPSSDARSTTPDAEVTESAPEAPPTTPLPTSSAPEEPAPPIKLPTDPRKSAGEPEKPSGPTKDASDIDPHEKLREELKKHGIDLGAVQDFIQVYIPAQQDDPHRAAAQFGQDVHKQITRDLVRKVARSIDATPVMPTGWDWLREGGIDAIAQHSPGTMLLRNDGVGLLYDRGVAHFIGDKSVGKSWVCTHLAIERMHAGEDVVWFDYETDEQQVAERFVQAGASLNMILNQLHYFNMKGEPIAGAVSTVAQLDPVPSCLIVDSVDASMAASGSEDENSSSGYHAWRNTITPLTESMICVLIEHTGHENAHRARGASAKGQQADMEFSAKVVKPFSKLEEGLVEWTCRKMRRGSVFTTDDVAAYMRIKPAGRVMHEGRPTAIDNAVSMELLAPTDPAVASMTMAAVAAAESSDRQKIIDWMRSIGIPVSRAKIRDGAKVDAGTVESVMIDLEADGKVTVDRSGRWPMFVLSE